jgi:hypothetical protein
MAIDAKAMTLSDILKESDTINVPRYQRPYKWERKLIEDIFEDVLMYGGGSRGVGGFMGSIVFCPGSDGAVDVVDGQQRLTTLTVMAAVLARRLLVIDQNSALAAKTFELLKANGGGGSRIQHKVFDKLIYEPLVSRELVGYMKVLWGGSPDQTSLIRAEALVKESKLYQAFLVLDDLVTESLTAYPVRTNVQPKDVFEGLLDALLNRIVLVRIRADEHTDGIRIFEALNTTGEPLTVEELVKSCYLMHSAKFGKATEDIAQAWWEDRQDGVHGYIKKDTDRDKFLRTFWLSRHGLITKSRLYDGYAEHLGKLSQGGSKNEMAGFGREISEAAKLYSEMSSSKGHWGCLELLESFGFEMHKVPLMALATSSKYGDSQSRERLMRLAFVLEVVLVRMSLTGQSTALIERSFCTLAESIRKGQFATLPQAFDRDVRFYFKNQSVHKLPDDQSFERGVQVAPITSRGDKWKLFALRIEIEMKFPGAEHYKSLPAVDERKFIRYIESDSDSPTSVFLKPHGFRDAKEYFDLKDTIGNFYFWDEKLKRAAKTPFNIINHSNPRRSDIISVGEDLSKSAAKVWSI